MNFRQALSEAVRQVFCSSLQAGDEFWGRIGAPGTLGAPGFRLRGSLGYRLFCNREPPPLPPAAPGAPPGTGNCDGVCYSYEVQVSGDFPGTLTSSGRLIGPVGGLRAVPLAGGARAEVFCRGTSPNSSVCPAPGALGWYPVGIGGTNVLPPSVITFTSLVRADNQPDTCGSPSPIVPSPDSPPPPIPLPVDYEDDDGDPVSIPFTIQFAIPFVFINGQLNVPFRITAPVEFNVPIDGTINLETGDINFNFGGGSGGGGGSCNPRPPQDFDSPEPAPLPPPGTEAPPVDLPGDDSRLKEVILGAIVTTQDQSGKVTIINQDSNPNLYIPRVANLQFAVQIGRSISWTERVNITNLRQFVPCPWQGGAVDVRVDPEPGFSSVVTPVTGKIPDDSSYS